MIRSFKTVLPVLVLFTGVLVASGPALAQLKTAATARIKQLNKMAMENYDGLEFEKAKMQLLEAVKLAKETSVSDKTVVGRIYLNLGVVVGSGFSDKAAAREYFLAALKVDRKVVIPAARATPALEEIFKAAKAGLGPEVPAAGAFKHRVVDEAMHGRPITIEVSLHESLGAKEVVLFFRKSGSATSFKRLLLTERGGGLYTKQIPAQAVEGRSIYYYVEARDPAGGRLAGSGEAASPNIIAIINPDSSPTGLGFQQGGHRKDPSNDEGRLSLSVAVMGGAGFGLVFGGESENAHPRISNGLEEFKKVDIAPGGALAPVHVAGEVAYHLDAHWQIAALVRVQLMTMLEGDRATDSVGVLGLLRAKRFFGDGVFQPLLAFGAGGGQIRHRIPLGDYDAEPLTSDDVVDARVAGIAALSVGAGFKLAFARHVGILVEFVGLFTVPDFAAHTDLNVGLVLSF
ncbi:MAG: hypothetical protein JRH20_02015 [Deltaproteobacteria bacterium]|nr:hypothetical protein [Deltaproteobacteria bacterium]